MRPASSYPMSDQALPHGKAKKKKKRTKKIIKKSLNIKPFITIEGNENTPRRLTDKFYRRVI